MSVSSVAALPLYPPRQPNYIIRAFSRNPRKREKQKNWGFLPFKKQLHSNQLFAPLLICVHYVSSPLFLFLIVVGHIAHLTATSNRAMGWQKFLPTNFLSQNFSIFWWIFFATLIIIIVFPLFEQWFSHAFFSVFFALFSHTHTLSLSPFLCPLPAINKWYII